MTGDATDVESHLDDLELLLADATPEELVHGHVHGPGGHHP